MPRIGPISLELTPALRALLLIAVASSVPWALGRVFRDRFGWPLDFGVHLPDGRRLFGAHKTWRGLLGGIGACSLVGWLLGTGIAIGAAAGALALSGDCLSSAIKRRFRHPPGTEVPGLDQLPEVLLPLLVLKGPLELSFMAVIAVAVVFTLLDLALTPLRHRPGPGNNT